MRYQTGTIDKQGRDIMVFRQVTEYCRQNFHMLCIGAINYILCHGTNSVTVTMAVATVYLWALAIK